MSKEYVTLKEIKQQPEMWQDTLKKFHERNTQIEDFFKKIKEKHDFVRVIFTGAGTSHFAGEVLTSYLNRKGREGFYYECFGTTDLVSNPYDYLESDTPIILVSFARSGNSPESVKAVELSKQLKKDIYQIYITCNENGELANLAKNDENALSFLLHPSTNDKGFAMTSSFSSMMLAALLIFSRETIDVSTIFEMAQEALGYEKDIKELMSDVPKRVIYVGSGPLAKLTREAQLKILELTAGEIATLYESSMGFRHGPKSFLNDETFMFSFISNNEYTRKYDLDVVNEVYQDRIVKQLRTISVGDVGFDGFKFTKGKDLEDTLLAFGYIVIAQLISYYAAIAVDNDVDSPSKSGTVNRVVKGVILHDYKKGC